MEFHPPEGDVPPVTPPPQPQRPLDATIPWERPDLGAFSAFGATLRMLLTSPRRAFEQMPVNSAFGRPLIFGVLVTWIGVLASTFWNLLLRGVFQSFFPWAGSDWGHMSAVIRVLVAMTAFIWIPVVLLVGAAIQHLFLLLFGGAKRGFAATFRVQCYAGAPAVLGVVPACGALVAPIWGIVLVIIGLSAAHGIGTGKAAAAVLAPILLTIGCVIVLITTVGLAFLGTLHH